MIKHRDWLSWFCMYWVIGININYGNRDETKYIQSTRWYIFAYIHMIIVQSRYSRKYPHCNIYTWLEWRTKK
jgi:hypothetical protein